jgi:hypothetical protein
MEVWRNGSRNAFPYFHTSILPYLFLFPDISLHFLSKTFFMNALIQSLQEKVGLTAEQAKGAASHMIDFIKAKIPASLHEHLDAAVNGDTIKTKGAEFIAEAKSKGGDFLHAAEEKIGNLLHSKEA